VVFTPRNSANGDDAICNIIEQVPRNASNKTGGKKNAPGAKEAAVKPRNLLERLIRHPNQKETTMTTLQDILGILASVSRAVLGKGRRATPPRGKGTRRLFQSFRPSVEEFEPRLVPTSWICVNTYSDAALRSAINLAVTESANNNPVMIDFNNGPGTIVLTAGVLPLNPGSGTGLITINGTSQNITINAQGESGVFEVGGSAQVEMDGLTIENGNTSGSGGGIDNLGTLTLNGTHLYDNAASNDGGGIFNYGSLTVNLGVPTTGPLTNTALPVFQGNSAQNGGGIFNEGNVCNVYGATISGNKATMGAGIYNEGAAQLLSSYTSSILENKATEDGGGIFNASCGTLTLSYAAISNNSAGDWGGGILNEGSLTLSGAAINGNTTQWGGGIFNEDSLYVYSSSIYSNTATMGGGIYNYVPGTVWVYSQAPVCSIWGNTALENGGGIYNTGTLNLSYPEMWVNHAGDCGGAIWNEGNLTANGLWMSSNSATEDGGGIFNGESMSLTNSQFYYNTAGYGGGGIFNVGTPKSMNGCTLEYNSAQVGGGIYIEDGTLPVGNTIVSNSAPTDPNIAP
jgi:hypothetical protein